MGRFTLMAKQEQMVKLSRSQRKTLKTHTFDHDLVGGVGAGEKRTRE